MSGSTAADPRQASHGGSNDDVSLFCRRTCIGALVLLLALSVLGAPASAATNATSASTGPAPTFQVSDTEGDGDQLEIGWENSSDPYSGSDVIRVTSDGEATKDYALVTVPTDGTTLGNDTSLSFVGEQVGGNHTATDELWVYLDTDGDGEVDAILYNHAGAAETSDASGGYERATFHFNGSDDGWTRFYPENQSSVSVNISDYYDASMTYAALGVGGPVAGPYVVDVRLDAMTLDGETLLDENPGTVKVRSGGPTFARASIQDGVDAAQAGDTVEVADGTYEGPVTVSKSLTVRSTTGDYSSSNVTIARSFGSYSKGNHIVTVSGSDVSVDIEGVTVRGDNVHAGVLVTNGAHADLTSVSVDDVADDPLSGAQHGFGVAVGRPVYNTTSGLSATATISDSNFEEFQKSAVTVTGEGTHATIERNTFVGQGVQQSLAQDTILIHQNGSATIRENTFKDVLYESGDGGRYDGGTGVTFYGGAQDVRIVDNEFQNVANGVSVLSFLGYGLYGEEADNVTIRDNTFRDTQSGLTFYSNPDAMPADGVVARDLVVRNNTYTQGKLFGFAIANGNVENATVANNTFSDNPVHVGDSTDGMFNQTVLGAKNDFSDVVLVDNETSGIRPTIYGDLGRAIDDAGTGDAVRALYGTFDPVTVDTRDLIVDGVPEVGRTTVDARSESTAITVQESGVVLRDVIIKNASGQAVRANARSTLVNNTIRSSNSAGLYTKSAVFVAGNTFVDDNPSAGSGDYGIRFDDAANATVTGNQFVGHQHGVLLSNSENVTIRSNRFSDLTTDGVLVSARKGQTAGGHDIRLNVFNATPNSVIFVEDVRDGESKLRNITVRRNRFEANSTALLALEQNNDGYVRDPLADTVDARYNWWGTRAGPTVTSDSIPANTYSPARQGANLSANAAYAPWLSAPNPEAPPFEPVKNLDTGEGYVSVQTAVSEASSNDTIEVGAGRYHESVDIETRGLTLRGAGESRTLVEIPDSDKSWGIYVAAGDVTLANLSVEGANADGYVSGQYGIHVSGPSTGRHIETTIRNVTVFDSGVSEIDLNGVENATVADVVLVGNETPGVGLAITDSRNVTVRNVVTVDNTWGGIGVFTNGQYGLPPRTDGLRVVNHTSVSEAVPLYTDPAGEKENNNITDLQLPGYEYRVVNESYRDGEFEFYYKNLQRALTEEDAANRSLAGQQGYVETIPGDTHIVGPPTRMQPAIEATANGDTVQVLNGTYRGPVRVDTPNVTLVGVDRNGTILLTNTSDANGQNHRGSLVLDADGTSVRSMTVARVVDGSVSDKHSKALAVRANRTAVLDTNVYLDDRTGSDDRGTALWIATHLAGGATTKPGLHDVTVRGTTVGSHANGVGIASLTDEDTSDVRLQRIRVNARSTGLFTFEDWSASTCAQTPCSGQVTDVTVGNSTFKNGQPMIADPSRALDMRAVITKNRFDRRVTVERPNDTFRHTVWTTVQPAANTATAGDRLELGPGAYSGSITIRTRNLTLVGAGENQTTIASEDTDAVATLRIARGAEGTTVRGLSVDATQPLRISELSASTVSTYTHTDDFPPGVRVEANETTITDVTVEAGTPVGVVVSNANATANHTTATPGELEGVTVEQVRFGEVRLGVAVVGAGDSGLTHHIRLGRLDASRAAAAVIVTGSSPSFEAETGTVRDVFVTGSDLRSGFVGVYAGQGSSDVEVHGSDLSSNEEYGVQNEVNETVVDARGNYWGAPTGPGGNVTSPRGTPANGEGSNVSEGVLFVPYKPVSPAVGGVTSIDVPETGVVGEPVSLSATVVNTQNESAEVTLPLAVNGRVVATKGVTVPADGTATVTFERTFDTSGDYRVSVGGVQPQSLTVKPDASLNVSYSVVDTDLLSDEPVRVTATVENTGGVAGTANVSLVVDGDTLTTRAVTVPAGESSSTTFARYLDVGEHAVQINNFEPTAVTVESATNLQADISVRSPVDDAVIGNDTVTVEFTDLADTPGIRNVSVRVDGGETRRLPLSTSTVTLRDLSEGRHTVELALVDNLGRTIAPTEVSFVVDTREPTARLDAEDLQGDGVVASAAQPATLTVNSDDATLESVTLLVRNTSRDSVVYRQDVTDQALTGPTAITYDTTNASGELPSGNYALELRAVDQAGNANSTSLDLTVDNTPPTIESIRYAPDGEDLRDDSTPVTANRTLGVTASVTGADTTRLRLVSTEYAHASAPIRGEGTFELNRSRAPTDGTYAVRVVAVDAAGNSATETLGTVTVDRQAPSVGAALTQKNGTHAYVNLSASEGLGEAPSATVQLPDGSTVSPTFDGPSDRSAVVELGDDGEYTLTVEATDAAGNSDTATTSASFNTVTTTDQATIVTSDGAFVTVRLDEPVTSSALVTTGDANTPLAELPADRIVSGFLSGSFGDAITANLTSATIGIPVKGSELPPGIEPVSVEIRRFNATTDAYEVTSNETAVVDDSDPSVPDSATADRYYVVNVSHFTVYSAAAQDTTEPTIDDTTVEADTSGSGDPPEFPYATDYVSTRVDYSDGQSGVDASAVEVYYDGTEVTDAAATTVTTHYAVYNATAPASAQHNVTVVVVDDAGNENSTSVTYGVEADTTLPTTDVTLSPTEPSDGVYAYGTDSVTVNVSYSDDTSRIDTDAVRVTFDNGSDARDVTGPAIVTDRYAEYTADGLSTGSYTVTVHVRDGAGNWNNRTVSFAVGTDTAAPTVSGVTVTPANGEPIDATPGERLSLGPGNESVRLAVTYTDDASGVNRSAIDVTFDGDSVTSAAAPTASEAVFTATDLANGTTHTLSLTLVDHTGNSRVVSVPFAIGEPVSEDPDPAPEPEPEPEVPDNDDDDTGVPAEPVADIGTPASGLINTLTNRVEFEVATERTESVAIAFDSDASGSVTVEPVESVPSGVAPPDGAIVAAVDIEVPPAQTASAATVRLEVTEQRLEALGAPAESLRVQHYDSVEGEWERLETSVDERTEDSVVVTAETPGFSLFAVTVAPEATPTPEPATPTPAPATTPLEATATEAATDAPAGTTAPATEESSGFRVPGFGAILAVVALIVTALLAARRTN